MSEESPADQKGWRREQRHRLLAARHSLPDATRKDLARRVIAHLDQVVGERAVAVLGLYWPIKREIDLLTWASALAEHRPGLALALPVVTAAKAPLEYWMWRPKDRMTRGFWNIPVPAEKVPAAPDLVIAPLVGFQDCWRLGYGGGYFDRTLAARKSRPVAIGVGFDLLEVENFIAAPHDMPMDIVITESRILRRAV
jgi:5-formyltetrahydrofolate cyclo-ligase